MVCPTLPLQKIQPAVFILGGGVNKILLEYNYTHLFIHCYWREWNSLGLKSQKYLLLGLLPKKKKKKNCQPLFYTKKPFFLQTARKTSKKDEYLCTVLEVCCTPPICQGWPENQFQALPGTKARKHSSSGSYRAGNEATERLMDETTQYLDLFLCLDLRTTP